MELSVVSVMLIIVSAMVLEGHAQTEACDPMDDGPYLATKPTLTFSVDEATADELQAAETSGSKKYYSELRLYGNYGAGDFTLTTGLNYRIIDPLEYFTFVTEGGKNYLKLTRPLDRDGLTTATDDDISYIPFTLTCQRSAPGATPVEYDARIFINDINDNEPVFTHGSGGLDEVVNEATPVGTVLFTAQALDKDANIDRNISYAFVDKTDMFLISDETGEVTLMKELDYESLGADKQITLTITAQDGGPGMIHTVTTTARIHVTDADDQGPAFVYEGCFTHMGVCAWPKYTTGLMLKQDQAIKVLPVPNKGQGEVSIKARDLDSKISNKIIFSIASTIPPGHEDEFTVDTIKGLGGEYVASIKPREDMMVHDGFEIFLKAEEQSAAMRHEIAMIFFMGPRDSTPDSSGQGSNNPSDGSSNSGSSGRIDDEDGSYSDLEVALIVVVAILATFLVCAIATLIFAFRRKRGGKSANIAMGSSNNGFTERL